MVGDTGSVLGTVGSLGDLEPEVAQPGSPWPLRGGWLGARGWRAEGPGAAAVGAEGLTGPRVGETEAEGTREQLSPACFSYSQQAACGYKAQSQKGPWSGSPKNGLQNEAYLQIIN